MWLVVVNVGKPEGQLGIIQRRRFRKRKAMGFTESRAQAELFYLVRHGVPVSSRGWTVGDDPQLSRQGHEQARRMVSAIASLGPLPVFSSPLLRARATAELLARQWGVQVDVATPLREIPPPAGFDPTARAVWLNQLPSRCWGELGASYEDWRSRVLEFAAHLYPPAVLVTHLVPINVLVGKAQGTEKAVHYWPQHCSITILECSQRWRVVRFGEETEQKDFSW